MGPPSSPGSIAATARPGVVAGLALGFCGYSLFSVQDATVKWLVASYAVPQILCLRSVVIVVVALAAGGGPRAIRGVAHSRNKVALAARAILILAAWMLFYSASAHMGLAEITTLYFAAPVIAVALSALLLKERVGAARWCAVAVGFVGVLVAAGPLGALSPGPAAAALAAAACWGTSTVLVRWIGRSDSTLTQMLSSNTLFALGCLPLLFWTWRTPDTLGLGLMLSLGAVGGLGQYLLFEGFRHAPASALAPIEYTGLVWASLYGYAIWSDVPRSSTIEGGALIMSGSVALAFFEDRRARRAAAEPTTAKR